MPDLNDNHLRVNRNTLIPLSEIELRISRSSGPGGQHANKTESRVEAIFDIEQSGSLGPHQRTRLINKFGPTVRAVAQDERSQLRNRELAVERLGQRIAIGLHVERKRKPTKPSKGAKESRLKAKRTRSEVKSQRRKPSADD